MTRITFFCLVYFVTTLSHTSAEAHAESPDHFTIILNQVRGPECCDPGNTRWFKEQQSALQKLNLVGNFALRYDAVLDETYSKTVLADKHNQYGALFEVTPQLANDAGVGYTGNLERWYEAHTVYLIGYSQEDRKKIIDTYMKAYQTVFSSTPRFSSAWMIDSWSLKYLKEAYGIVAHQLTREQYGTDSYTLYGGPAHYPYYPSTNWAMIPQPNNQSMPLILRQTIMDPVYNYGDTTNSYTSQPNDYFLRKDTIAYFRHLFSQAHSQANPYTIAVLGLENTMAEPAQLEFFDQLKEVKQWEESNPSNMVPSVLKFTEWYTLNQVNMTSYTGKAQSNPSEQAWIINTPKYRARVRLSNKTLMLTDLRLYDTNFEDPYFSETAKDLGWWIVPFVLDTSRYRTFTSDGTIVLDDSLIGLKKNQPKPVFIPLAENVREATLSTKTLEGKTKKTLQIGEKIIVIFSEDGIELNGEPNLSKLENLKDPHNSLVWNLKEIQTPQWGFKNEYGYLKPFVRNDMLGQARQNFRQALFPEKRFEPLSSQYTWVYINNQSAIAGKNPIRLIVYPQNSNREPILVSEKPSVSLSNPVDTLSVLYKPQEKNSFWIELSNAKPLSTEVTIRMQQFKQTIRVFFAPNCKENLWHCITNPRQGWWYIRDLFGSYRWRS